MRYHLNRHEPACSVITAHRPPLSRVRYPQALVNTGPDPNTHTVLWNGMIVPLLNYTVLYVHDRHACIRTVCPTSDGIVCCCMPSCSGAVWYQGEANAGNPKGVLLLSDPLSAIDTNCSVLMCR